MPKVPGREKKQTIETEKKFTGVGRVIQHAEGEAGHVHGERSDTTAGGELNGSPHSRDRQVRQDFLGVSGVVGEVARFISDYIDMPSTSVVVSATWVVASHVSEIWSDGFPHLAITSPEKRCGKSTLLNLLELICLRSRLALNISQAVLYRVIEQDKPTLLFDEAQVLNREKSETGTVIREMLNAGIRQNAKVPRCVGEGHEVKDFPIYGPKVFALIGNIDPILADRSLPIRLERKKNDSKVNHFRVRQVEPVGHAIRERLVQWAGENRDRLQDVYDRLLPLDIDNDRMADLLMPLQAIMEVSYPEGLSVLQEYADQLDRKSKEAEVQSPGIRLLAACREIFAHLKPTAEDGVFIKTPDLIHRLCLRDEEPWPTYTRGKQITPEALANLLREFGIKSTRNRKQTARGFFAQAFHEAWGKYLPPGYPEKNQSNPSIPANSATGGKVKSNPSNSSIAANPSDSSTPSKNGKAKKGGVQ